MITVQEKTRYEIFVKECQDKVNEDYGAYSQTMWDNGVYACQSAAKGLRNLQNKISLDMMVYFFGDRMGEHYWDKFTRVYARNLLNFLDYLEEHARFFILYEVSTNKLGAL